MKFLLKRKKKKTMTSVACDYVDPSMIHQYVVRTRL